MDQVLEYNKDPEYLRRDLLCRLTLKAQKRMREVQTSKREVIRRMGATPRSSTGSWIKRLAALDCAVELTVDEAA